MGPASEGGIEGDDERCVSCMRFTFLLRVGQSTAAAVEAEQASAALCCSAAAGAAAGIERSDHSRTALYGSITVRYGCTVYSCTAYGHNTERRHSISLSSEPLAWQGGRQMAEVQTEDSRQQTAAAYGLRIMQAAGLLHKFSCLDVWRAVLAAGGVEPAACCLGGSLRVLVCREHGRRRRCATPSPGCQARARRWCGPRTSHALLVALLSSRVGHTCTAWLGHTTAIPCDACRSAASGTLRHTQGGGNRAGVGRGSGSAIRGPPP